MGLPFDPAEVAPIDVAASWFESGLAQRPMAAASARAAMASTTKPARAEAVLAPTPGDPYLCCCRWVTPITHLRTCWFAANPCCRGLAADR
jgi:hypothetical protein